MGKATKNTFVSSVMKSAACLDYIHSDLWGSPNIPLSLSGYQYFVTFVDDFSRKV